MSSTSSISIVEGKLPAGFRFHPRDEELICDYLMNKFSQSHNQYSTLLTQVDLNKSEPWQLPESACVGLGLGRKEWYFYSQRDRKYATGLRTNRATSCGYWKATGKDRPVVSSNSNNNNVIVGMRKTLVFYQGRAPKGTKTDWVMHEFRLEGPLAPPISSLQEDWVLCRVFFKTREISSNSFNSLPALTDDQHQLQVPCFSDNIHLPPTIQDLFFEPKTSQTPVNGMPNLGDTDTHNAVITLDPFYDNEVLRDVLTQLTNIDRDPNLESIGHPSSQTDLSQFGSGSGFGFGMPNIWTHY